MHHMCYTGIQQVSRVLRLFLVGCVAWTAPLHVQDVSGQSATEAGETYFHRAAQHYLAEDLEAAREIVTEGLRIAPDHPKLQALNEQLNARPPDADGEADPDGAPDERSDEEGDEAGNSTGERDADGSSDELTDEEREDESGEAPDSPSADMPSSDDTDESDNGERAEQDGRSETSPDNEADDAAGGTGSSERGEANNQRPDSARDMERGAVDPLDPPHDSDASPERPPHPPLPLEMPTLTPEQAEQLLQLFDAQDRPLMHTLRQFGRASEAQPDR